MTSSPDGVTAWSPDLLPDSDPASLIAVEPGAEGPLALPDLVAVRVPVPLRIEAPRSPLDESYQRGLVEGLRQGEARARATLESAVAALRGAAEALAAAQADFNRTRGRNLAGLAVAVANRIIQREVAAEPGIIKDLVRQALDLLPTDQTVELRLAPADLEQLRDAMDGVVAEGRPVELRWIADPSQERGSFTLESPQRLVDGRTDVALRALYERLAYE